MNHSKRIQFTNGNVTEFIYTSTGEKLRTIHHTAVNNISVPIGSTLTLTTASTLSVDSTDYIGNFIFENGKADKYLFNGGYCSFASTGLPIYHYYTQDHRGNNRAVINENGTLEQVTHYYPFGGIYGDTGINSSLQPYKYNGKELDRMHGLDWYDYGARSYDPALGRFTTIDPLTEKYYKLNPYAYCGDNPVNAIDPDGMDVIITGPLANKALEQIQARVGKNITLSLDKNNYMCYSITNKGHINSAARQVINIVDNDNIVIKMETRDNNVTSTGNLFIGGAFMGNNVESSGNGKNYNVTAYQEINPKVLGKADKYSPKGTFVMHELTEAYEGSKISIDNEKSSPNSNGKGSVYKEAHEKATNQPPVYQRLYDVYGNITTDATKAQRIEWYVKPNEKKI